MSKQQQEASKDSPKEAKESVKDDEKKSEENLKESIGSKVNKFVKDFKNDAKALGKKMENRLTMEGLLKQGRESIKEFFNLELDKNEKKIPLELISNCAGICLLTQVKASMIFGGSVGTGIIMKRLNNNNWSLPCAIGTSGVQGGLNIGAQKIDHVLILRTNRAVKEFSKNGDIKLGGDLSIAAGKTGRNANIGAVADKKDIAAIISYSKSKGAYVGIALEGIGLINREDCNKEFYDPDGKQKDKVKYNADTIWSGKFEMPKNEDYNAIVKTLRDYINKAENEKKKKKNDDDNKKDELKNDDKAKESCDDSKPKKNDK